jgi:hypothetical protein
VVGVTGAADVVGGCVVVDGVVVDVGRDVVGVVELEVELEVGVEVDVVVEEVVGVVLVVVVVDVVGDEVVGVVEGSAVLVTGGGGSTVTVGLLLGPITVLVIDVGGGDGSFGVGLVLPRFNASNTATKMAAPAPATLKTRAVRLYHGSVAASAA